MLNKTLIAQCVQITLTEDLGSGDLTASLIPENHLLSAHIVCRQPAVLCGQAFAEHAFKQLDNDVKITWLVSEGTWLAQPTSIATITGSARSILTAERTALNFLQTLSATATVTRQFVECIQSTQATILDTRKTLPGLRAAQKYAVTIGGGQNHRFGLFDAILIKENHIHAAGGIGAAINTARAMHPSIKLEIEIENLDEFKQAHAAKPDVIMLDNFSLELLAEAVKINTPHIPLEVSGNVSLENINAIAQTGVDYISIGALTKNIQAIDFSMRFIEPY